MIRQPSADIIIRNATDQHGKSMSVCICAGRITSTARVAEDAAVLVVDAKGRALLPALNDHHLHLCATAVAQSSVLCGPPDVHTREGLHRQLSLASPDAQGWIRGRGYDAGVAGDLDCTALDALLPDLPLRIQHAGGRLWTCNSKAVALLGDGPWETQHGRITGRLYDADAWLRTRLGAEFPDLSVVSLRLAQYGVVGVTDTSPANAIQTAAHFRAAYANGALRQRLLMMGDASLDADYVAQTAATWPGGVRIGHYKIHLLESNLPDFDTLCERVRERHACGRAVAFHCVSRVELVFAIAVLRCAGQHVGDRIEHAGICPDELLLDLLELGVCVVTQPVFVHGRGDRYRRDVPADEQPDLYRLRAIADRGIGLAASSDAPYGDLSPWQGMASAVQRRTAAGELLGIGEALSAEHALHLYSGNLLQPSARVQSLSVGMAADLCLLDTDWAAARENLAQVHVALTVRDGVVIWNADGL